MVTCGIVWIAIAHSIAYCISLARAVCAFEYLVSHGEEYFSVDGTYNTRYEIVKKRIEKPHSRNRCAIDPARADCDCLSPKSVKHGCTKSFSPSFTTWDISRRTIAMCCWKLSKGSMVSMLFA